MAYPINTWYYVTTTNATSINLTGFANISQVNITETNIEDLVNSLIPTMTSDTTGSFVASQLTGQVNAYTAFVGSGGLWYQNAGSGFPNWLKIDTGGLTSIGAFSMTSDATIPSWMPTDWEFQGSDDDTNWTTIGTYSSSWVGGDRKSFSAKSRYRYFRWYFTGGSTAYQRLAYLELHLSSTSTKYLVSFDGRTTWKYWNGSAWTVSSLANLSVDGKSSSEMSADLIAHWTPADGTSLDFATGMMTTDSAVTPTLDNIQVVALK